MSSGAPSVAFWGERTPEEGAVCTLVIENLRLWLKRQGREWYLAHEYDPEQTGGEAFFTMTPEAPAPEPAWRRYVTGREEKTVCILPELPGRALVVHPEQSLVLTTGSEIRVFVAVPVSVRILAGEVVLDTLPTRILSNTWFGEPAAGELCYALTSQAVRRLDGLESGPDEAVCAVTILNRAGGELDFQRFCMRVEHLSIYRGASRLWTNSMRVEYRGEPGAGQVTISAKTPEYEKVEEKLTSARRPAKKTLMTSSFHILKTLTGF